MKHIYLLLLFFSVSFCCGQDVKANGGIDGFKLYPNPVTEGKVFINTTQNAPKQVLIFDVLGTRVLKTTILGSELNLSKLDAGVYLLRVYERNKVATRKLLII